MENNETYKRLVSVIDEVYELTRDDGYRGGLGGKKGDPTRNFRQAVLLELRRRGVLWVDNPNHNKRPFYRWIASSSPTENFYKSMAKSLIKTNKPQAQAQKKEHTIGIVAAGEHTGKVAVASLKPFSDEELWEELKKRGARLVDGKLVIIKQYELS